MKLMQFVQAHQTLFIAAAVYLLLVLASHKSQVDAWCMKNPKRAGFMKLLRGAGFDPWMMLQGATLLLKGRLPEYLLKIVAAAAAASLLIGCAGTFDAPNTPPQLAASTTRKHCVVLDAESDWLPPIGAGLGATSTGIGAIAAAEDKPSVGLKVTAVVLGAAALTAGGVGLAASKSFHEQCVTQPTGK